MQANLDYLDEIFVPVIGFEGLYEISNYGRLKSLARSVKRGDVIQRICERFIKPDLNSKGYLRNKCNKEGQIFRFLVHRMVAEYFVENPNPELYDQVNHIDGNPQNPYYKNLEWCTASMNHKHRFDVLGHIGPMTGKPAFNRKEVIKMDHEGNELARYDSALDAAKENNLSHSFLCACCCGIRNSSLYKWRYA